MFYTGLERYKTADVNAFTSEMGMKLRRKLLNKTWRKIARLCTSRKIVVEQYPKIKKEEAYVFACNHSFEEDIISALAVVDRNVYMLHGSTHQMVHNPVFLALWLNGMIYVDRMNTESQLIQPLFASPYILSKELGVKVVPLITFNDIGSDTIYIRAGEPMDLSWYEKYEAMSILRDEMSTLCYLIMKEHVPLVKRSELLTEPRKGYLEVRKQVYECQKWYEDVWEEELTYYPGHNITTPKQAREFVDRVKINSKNAHIFADMLARREEDIKYDLKNYIRENIKYAK